MVGGVDRLSSYYSAYVTSLGIIGFFLNDFTGFNPPEIALRLAFLPIAKYVMEHFYFSFFQVYHLYVALIKKFVFVLILFTLQIKI